MTIRYSTGLAGCAAHARPRAIRQAEWPFLPIRGARSGGG